MGSLMANLLLGIRETLVKDRHGQEWICKVKDKIPKSHRPPSDCKSYPEQLPCLDINKIEIERARPCHRDEIVSYFYKNYWHREPAIAGLYVSSYSPYLRFLANKYATEGDRFLCYENTYRNEKKLVGIAVGEKSFPWTPDELEQWSVRNLKCHMEPEGFHTAFLAFCMQSANLFERYNVPYVYDVVALGTIGEVMGHGIGSLLFHTLVLSSMELRHPIIRVIATNAYMARMCERLKMTKEWTMPYVDIVDHRGKGIFTIRKPHYNVSVYTRLFNPALGAIPHPCDDPILYKTYLRSTARKRRYLKHKVCRTHENEYLVYD